ncbi:MAG TPA: potassium channel protein [Pseudomonadota bacterium]|nr:potassium channel protein [Pseudomonadota bacterium]
MPAFDEPRYDPFRFLKWGAWLLLGLTLVSTIVFWLLGRYYGRPDWTIVNCLFMVVITLTTIGYGDWLELKSLHMAEFFTMALAMVGIAVPAFLVSNITALVVEGLFTDVFRRRRMHKRIAALNDHIIVCGVGSTGVHCVTELLSTGRPFVAIDHNEAKLKHMVESLGDFLYIVGSAETDDVLLQAGIERASGLIACLTEDKDNVFVTLTARQMNRNLRIISKVLEDSTRKKLSIAGANGSVNPTAIGGLRLVSELVRPTVVTFLDNMIRDRRSSHRFEQLEIAAQSEIAGKRLQDANFRATGRSLVVAVKPPDAESFIYNPAADIALAPGSQVVFLASTADMATLRHMCSAPKPDSSKKK